MAINKKLIHFKNKENFDKEVANENILDSSIVFIQDSKEISTHGTVYKSVNWSVLGEGNMNYKTNYAIINALLREDSKLWSYEPEYFYNSLEDAITDINNSVKELAISDSTNAKIKVVKNNIFFLDNITLSSPVTVSSTINMYINNKQFNCNGLITVTVTGCLNIYADKCKINTNCSTFLNIEGYCSLVGGNYNIKISGNETSSLTPEKSIIVSGTLNIKNVVLEITNSIGSATVIWTEENSILRGFNSIITCNIPDGFAYGLYSNGEVELEHCKVTAHSNHTANAAGTDYATTSRGIKADLGSLELSECYVYGAHSGITVKCPLKITGGIYNGFSHGGIYASANNSEIILSDCEINDVDISEGCIYDAVAGTNHAAFYIGAGSYMNIYVDNCRFYGVIQPIVMKYNSSSSHDNYLYLSNTTINTDYTRSAVRNDGANYIKFGMGVNITSSDLENDVNWEETGLCYRK